jgi:tetratricopeptide (TPR) repeat protein
VTSANATAERARQALELVTADPRQASELAADLASQAAASADHEAGSIALRARGLAAVHLDAADAAVAYLRRAVELGHRARSPELAAEARMTLAYALSTRGQLRAALRAIELALTDLTGVERARARAQRGAILFRLGRLNEAAADYRSALQILRRAGDLLWVQRVLSNLGYLRVYFGEVPAAVANLHEAEALCRRLGLELSLGFAHQNLGFAWTVGGDIPAALHYLDLAERCFVTHGSQLGSLLVDRAEVLLSARLVPEALDAARRAVTACVTTRQEVLLPEARLLLARAAQLSGDTATALREARTAARECRQAGRIEWAAIARVRVLTIRLETEPDLSVTPARIQREIAASGGRWPGTELEVQLAGAERALARQRNDQARTLLAAASRHRHGGPTVLRAAAWHAEALLRRLNGNQRGAVSAARAGLRLLDAHATALGATDLRAYASAHRTKLVELGLRAAFDDGNAARVFDWAELGRARHLQYPPARPPDDPRLAAALAELRAVVREIQERRVAGRAAAGLVARRRELERLVRDHHRRLRADETAGLSTPSLAGVSAALAGAALLEFVELDGWMYGLCMVDRKATLHSLAPLSEITALVGALPFALHRLVRRKTDPASRHAAAVLVRDTAARLDAMLIRSIPGLDDRPLVIVPTGPLQPLPWSILPSCAGRPVTVAPSATLWSAAQARRPPSGRVIVAAGPGLPGAQAEARAVAATYDSAPMVGDVATVKAVATGLDSAPLAHLAAHGTVRADNPLFSALHLADGPLMVYDLQLLHRLPHTVVIAACDSGRAVAPVGDELMGLSATFLAQGTAQVIASVIPIHDIDTMPLMIALHDGMAAGVPPATALASAQEALYRTGAEGLAIAAGFVCFGAGLASPSRPSVANRRTAAFTQPT